MAAVPLAVLVGLLWAGVIPATAGWTIPMFVLALLAVLDSGESS